MSYKNVLNKRIELFSEAELIMERLAEIKNDIQAVDKTLRIMGYDGELDAVMPRQRRHVIFGQGELLDSLILELRHADRPLKSRELAQNVLASSGNDIRDRRAVSDLTRRVSKCLRVQREAGLVIGQLNDTRVMEWQLRP
ncbi:MAG: hypothetical protein Q9M45_03135 [Robiginitomaculum sp.]|nr:hypothetical protein [Robiginitomaculum sp.]